MVAAWVVGGAVSWNLAAVGAAAPAVAERYGIALPAVGLFATAMFTAQMLLQIPAGRLVDRVGVRNAGAAALVVVMAGNALALLDGGLLVALALRALVGVALGMGFVAGAAGVRVAGGSTFEQGIYGGIALGAGGVAIAVVGSLGPTLGWSAPFVTGLVVAGLGLLPLAATPPPPRRAATGRATPLSSVLTDRRLVPFAVVNLSTFGLSVIVGSWSVPLLLRHGDARSAAWVGSLTLLGALVSRPLAGLATARRPDRTRSLVAASLLLGPLGMVLLTLGRPEPVALAGSLLVGLCAGVPFGPVYSSVTALHRDAAGLAVSVTNIPALLLVLVGTPLVGWTFQLPGEGRIGFLALAAGWAASALLLPREWPRADAATVGCPRQAV